jgi:uncharacterized phage protein gp47/JayE
MYDLLDFNLSQHFISTASGAALDMLGSLYGVSRKSQSNLVTISKRTGSFCFYLDSPAPFNIVVPVGTKVYTNTSTFVGQQYSYETTEQAIIPAGRVRAFVGIKPLFTDSVFTAGSNMLVVHNFASPPGYPVLCKNPKPIQAQAGYEDDESYRFRITKAIRVSSSGTAEAVRFAGLGVAGVRDVRINQAAYGLGSFEAIVIPEDYNTVSGTLERATTAMQQVRPVGVRLIIKRPTIRSVDVSVNLIIAASNVTGVVDAAKGRAREVITRYISGLLPGDQLVYNKMVQLVLDSSDLIKDMIVVKFMVGGAESARRNFQPETDHHLVPGNIVVGVASS